MALLLHDEVALRRDLTAPTLAARGRPMFGVVQNPAGPVDILWEDGSLVTGIVSTLLDKVVGANAPQSIVTFSDGTNGKDSPAYQGTVVRRYTRQNDGAGPTNPFTLIRLPNGEELEVPTTAVVELPGQ